MATGQGKRVVVLHNGDDVAVALEPLAPNDTIETSSGSIRVKQNIPTGHKIALRDVSEGNPVFKYGEKIGMAMEPIGRGAHVHTHNLALGDYTRTYEPGTRVTQVPVVEGKEAPTFAGFKRPDGRVGTRNYVLVISTVNCSASAAKRIAGYFDEQVMEAYPNVDGVVAITHKSGCGMKLNGEDHRQLQRTLAGFARNPNVGGAVLVGLGCEVNQAEVLITDEELDQEHAVVGGTPAVFNIQDLGGFEATVDAGIQQVKQLVEQANQYARSPQPISQLVVGLECGGSDANSGIAANPAVGAAVDQLVPHGGTAVFGETPEIYGAEHLLIQRAATEGVALRLAQHVQWWEHYTRLFDASIDNNPSPGNKAGGLTTIYEKSLGAIAKAGTMPLKAVYNFAETVDEKGLTFMDTPGTDAVSITGFIAGGATVVIFTTGRGSVNGSVPAPTIKVASNPRLYELMSHDMDINAGRILEGIPLQEVGQEIFDEIIAVASGKPTKSEAQGTGEEEFSPWTIGPTL